MAEHQIATGTDMHYVVAAVSAVVNIAADELAFSHSTRLYEAIAAVAEVGAGFYLKGNWKAALVTGGVTLGALTLFDYIAGK